VTSIVFPVGNFYTCTEPETLHAESPEDALEEHLDPDLHPKMTPAQVLACIRLRPVTITAYNPMEISDELIDAWAENLLESLGETFSDEHGDPDSGCCDAFPSDAEQVMRDAVRSIIRRSTVWACEAVGKVTLSPDQIEEVMREHRPDWFVETAPPPSQGAGDTRDEEGAP
jgi:hypothetical protein